MYQIYLNNVYFAISVIVIMEVSGVEIAVVRDSNALETGFYSREDQTSVCKRAASRGILSSGFTTRSVTKQARDL